jgi:hypothetical protein
MKVFISWSGNRSRAVADLMADWIKCVLQATQPWMSDRDIDRGSLWFSEINGQLQEISVGIVCLTNENKGKPWILFEAGALAKGISSSRVCTFLIDLDRSELEDPLAQFNHTFPTEAGLRSLIETLNVRLGDQRLEDRILDQVFRRYWDDFEKRFSEILEKHPPVTNEQPKSEQKFLSEILEVTRGLEQNMRRIEARLEPELVKSNPPVFQHRLARIPLELLFDDAIKAGIPDNMVPLYVAERCPLPIGPIELEWAKHLANSSQPKQP